MFRDPAPVVAVAVAAGAVEVVAAVAAVAVAEADAVVSAVLCNHDAHAIRRGRLADPHGVLQGCVSVVKSENMILHTHTHTHTHTNIHTPDLS